MTAQLALDLPGITTPDYAPDLSLAERFALFHAANPHVADALEHLAAEWFAAGNTKCSAKALAERLRWEVGIRTQGEPWRLNNSHVAFYARLLIERRPEWSDAFSLRVQHSAEPTNVAAEPAWGRRASSDPNPSEHSPPPAR